MTKESWLADILNGAGQLNRITDTTTHSTTTPAGISSTAQKLGANIWKDLYSVQGAYRSGTYSQGGLVKGYSEGGLVEPDYSAGEHVGGNRQGYFLGGLAVPVGLAALLAAAGYFANEATGKPEIENIPNDPSVNLDDFVNVPTNPGLVTPTTGDHVETDQTDMENQMRAYGIEGDNQRYNPQYDPSTLAMAYSLMSPEPGDNALSAFGKAGLASLGLAEKEREKEWTENNAYNTATKQEVIKSNILQRMRERQNLTEGKSNAAFVQMVNMLKKMGKTDDQALAMANAIIMGQKAKFTGDGPTDQAMIDMINSASAMFTGNQSPTAADGSRMLAYDRVKKKMQAAY
jgi:hypothetical protein